MKITVDGVELTVTQDGNSVSIKRIIGRDRKRKLDITAGITFDPRRELDPTAIAIAKTMRAVAAMRTAPCTCDYRYGWSGHADHCLSIYVATYDGCCADDD